MIETKNNIRESDRIIKTKNKKREGDKRKEQRLT